MLKTLLRHTLIKKIFLIILDCSEFGNFAITLISTRNFAYFIKLKNNNINDFHVQKRNNQGSVVELVIKLIR
jgi:hypothetical protein